jgi:hypothetical protein
MSIYNTSPYLFSLPYNIYLDNLVGSNLQETTITGTNIYASSLTSTSTTGSLGYFSNLIVPSITGTAIKGNMHFDGNDHLYIYTGTGWRSAVLS